MQKFCCVSILYHNGGGGGEWENKYWEFLLLCLIT